MDRFVVGHPVEKTERWVDEKCRISHPRYIQLMCWPLGGTVCTVQVLCYDDVVRSAWEGDVIVYHGNLNFSVEAKLDEKG